PKTLCPIPQCSADNAGLVVVFTWHLPPYLATRIKLYQYVRQRRVGSAVYLGCCLVDTRSVPVCEFTVSAAGVASPRRLYCIVCRRYVYRLPAHRPGSAGDNRPGVGYDCR